MSFTFAGYFPKRIAPRPDWLKAPQVVDVYSVSTCVSKGPPDWWERDDLNELRLFDRPPTEPGYTILAYRIWEPPIELPALDGPAPGFTSIGFDAVQWQYGDFGCSPLSCNSGADRFATNEHCLFRTLDEAITGARAFAAGGWEPGPYWVVEVLGIDPAH